MVRRLNSSCVCFDMNGSQAVPTIPIATRPERVQLAALIQLMTDDVAPLASARGIKFSTAVSSDIEIKTQLSDLGLILRNLIDNAVRYSETDGEVSITATRSSQHVMVEVLDHGTGISEELLPFIYDLFLRKSGSV